MTEEERPAWAVRIQAEREARGWSKAEMARRLREAVGVDHMQFDSLRRQIGDWEAGKHRPRDWRRAYAIAFELDEDHLFSWETSARPCEDDGEMERRKLLQALATLGVSSPPVLDALQSIGDSVDRAIGRDEGSHLDEWEETVAEYGYSYVLLPPHRLLTDLAVDLVTVQRIMARSKHGGKVFGSWCRVAGALAMLTAKTLRNLGQARQARTWWRTAQQAADLSRDANLSLWVGGEHLVHGIYERRPGPILLRRVNWIADRALGAPCRGRAQLHTVRAQLLALNGQADAAKAELRCGRDVFEQPPTSVTNEISSIAGWAEDRLLYTEAWVHAYLGERDQLDHAVDRAREILPLADYRVRAQVSLLQAFGHVRSGDVTEGVRYAQDIFEAHPVEQRTTMVTALADQVLEAVPLKSRNEPAIVGYRELLASGTQRKAIM